MSSNQIIEYIHREGCHLCDEYLPQFIAFTAKYNLQFIQKDVDSSYQLYELYNVEVPAVVLNKKIINRYFFNEDELIDGLHLSRL